MARRTAVLLILLMFFVVTFSFNGKAMNSVEFQQLVSSLSNSDSEEIIYLNSTTDTFKTLSEEDYQIVGFTNLYSSSGYKVYFVQPGDTLYYLALKFNTTVKQIKKINKLKSDYLYVGQKLYIPDSGDGEQTEDRKDEGDTIIYIVQPGDTLFLLARRFNTSIGSIKELNNLSSEVLYVGQKLLIPGERSEDNNDSSYLVYTVQPGDSLYLISRKFNTTIQEIMNLNNLTSSYLYVGQKLRIPQQENRREDEIPEMESEVRCIYFVQPGDTLYLLAQKFETTVTRLRELNKLNTSFLNNGQMLYVPVKGIENDGKRRIVYFVRPGDNLFLLAQKFGTTEKEIIELNNLNSEILYPGQRLFFLFEEVEKNYNLILKYTVEKGETITQIARMFDVSSLELVAFNNLSSGSVYSGQELSIPLSVPDNELGQKVTISQEDLNLLARAVYSEARGEPFKGQVAVAAVVLNRVQHYLFPDTIKDVIFQPWQFSAVHDGQFWLEPEQHAFVAARAALQGWDPTKGAIYYYNPRTATSEWVYYRNVIVKIGNHYFCI